MKSFCLLLFSIAYCRAILVSKLTNPILLGQSPHWNTETQKLYFVDVMNNTINSYDPETGRHQMAKLNTPGGDRVSFIIPVSGRPHEFVVSTGLDIRHVEWNDSGKQKIKSYILYTAKQAADGSRFNEAKVDGEGRLWAGTMGPESSPNLVTQSKGKLYSVTHLSGLVPELEDILITGGLAWTIDGSVMYFVDGGTSQVESFEFDQLTWPALSNRRLAFDYTAARITGKPRGITIDRNGNLWVAGYGGSQIVINVNPTTGQVLQRISIPAMHVSSLTWGGPNLDVLYVTTSRHGMSTVDLAKYPLSGSIFNVTGLGVSGYPGENYPLYSRSGICSLL